MVFHKKEKRERLKRFGGKTKGFVRRTAQTTGEIASKVERARRFGVSATSESFRTATGVSGKKQDIRAKRLQPQPFISSGSSFFDKNAGGMNIAKALQSNGEGKGTQLQSAFNFSKGKKKRSDPLIF